MGIKEEHMKVYAWNESGLLIDINGRELREDVLNGGFLPHAENETTDVPPAMLARQTCRRVGGSWSVIPDNRGVTYYDASTREPHTITEAGIEPEDSWTETKPPAEPCYTYNMETGTWVLDIAAYREIVIAHMSERSFAVSEQLFPEYKARNIERGVCTYEAPYTLENKIRTDQACRAEFYRVKALVEAAQTREEIDAVAAAWPAWIVEQE